MLHSVKKKLGEIVDIRTGYSFRAKVEDNPLGDIYVINMKNLNKDYSGFENADSFRKVVSVGSMEKNLLKEKEILLVAKGLKNKAILFDKPYKAIATSIFLILTVVDEKEVSPEYIAWYLNQKTGQRDINKVITGSVQRNISSKALKDMEIPIPSIKTQKMIGSLGSLINKEQELISLIKVKKDKLIQGTLLNDLISNE